MAAFYRVTVQVEIVDTNGNPWDDKLQAVKKSGTVRVMRVPNGKQPALVKYLADVIEIAAWKLFAKEVAMPRENDKKAA